MCELETLPCQKSAAAPLLQGIVASHADFSREIRNMDFHVKSPDFLHMCMLNGFSHIRLFVTLWTAAHQAPLSMGFSRQEHWSELSFSTPGHLPDPGIKSESPV